MKKIKFIYNVIICKIKGHTRSDGGSCPFTGKKYEVCTRCSMLFVVGKYE